MAQANVYASVAGTVGRSDKDAGAVGVFRRPAETGVWEHVISDLSSNVVHVHPTDPNIVFAGTHDGVYRSTDRGKTFRRANFPDKGMEIWSFLVDAGNSKLVYAGGSPTAGHPVPTCACSCPARSAPATSSRWSTAPSTGSPSATCS